MIEYENFYSFVAPQKVDTDIIKDAGSEYYFYKQRASRLCRHQELYRSYQYITMSPCYWIPTIRAHSGLVLL